MGKPIGDVPILVSVFVVPPVAPIGVLSALVLAMFVGKPALVSLPTLAVFPLAMRPIRFLRVVIMLLDDQRRRTHDYRLWRPAQKKTKRDAVMG